jgi:hypothetical protein
MMELRIMKRLVFLRIEYKAWKHPDFIRDII